MKATVSVRVVPLLLLAACAVPPAARAIPVAPPKAALPASVALYEDYVAAAFDDPFDREVQALLVLLLAEEPALLKWPAEDDKEGQAAQYRVVKRCKKLVAKLQLYAGREPEEDELPPARTDLRRTVEHVLAVLCSTRDARWVDLHLLELAARALHAEANRVVLSELEWRHCFRIIAEKAEAAPRRFGAKYDIRAWYQALAVETILHTPNCLPGEWPATPDMEKNDEFDAGMKAIFAWIRKELDK